MFSEPSPQQATGVSKLLKLPYVGAEQFVSFALSSAVNAVVRGASAFGFDAMSPGRTQQFS